MYQKNRKLLVEIMCIGRKCIMTPNIRFAERKILFSSLPHNTQHKNKNSKDFTPKNRNTRYRISRPYGIFLAPENFPFWRILPDFRYFLLMILSFKFHPLKLKSLEPSKCPLIISLTLHCHFKNQSEGWWWGGGWNQ